MIGTKNKYTTIVNLSILIFCSIQLVGCGSGANSTVNQPGDITGSDSQPQEVLLSTATPPASPDMRGNRYEVVLFSAAGAPFAALSGSISAGVEDGVRHINSSGGIYGAQVDFVEETFAFGEEDINTRILEAIDEMDPLIVLMAVPIDEGLLFELSKLATPVLYFGLGKEVTGNLAKDAQNIFWLAPPPDAEMAFFVSEIWQHWGRLRPAGVFNQVKLGYASSNVEFNMIEKNPGLETFLRTNNYQIALWTPFAPSPNPSASNFIIDSISAGVTVIYTDTYSRETAVLLNDLHSMSVTNFFVTGGAFWSIDNTIQGYLLSERPLEKYLVILPIAWWNELSLDAIQTAREIHLKYGRSIQMMDAGYLVALGAVDIAAETIRSSIDELETGQIDSEDLLDQLEILENYDVMNGLFRVDYSDGNRFPTQLKIWQVSVGGDWLPIGSGGEIPLNYFDSD